MKPGFQAVAFDLDGTLYPNIRFYRRLLPFIIKEHRFLRAMGAARTVLRSATQSGRFYDLQARLMAEILNDDPATVKAKTEALIYRGWEPLFKGLRLFDEVRETLTAFKKTGLKLGLMSDFPPQTKLEYLNLTTFWDIVLCTESIGWLKPDPRPFAALSKALETDPAKILYVGNSIKYDVVGAKNAGFAAALISPCWRRRSSADFVFSHYRQLRHFVLT